MMTKQIFTLNHYYRKLLALACVLILLLSACTQPSEESATNPSDGSSVDDVGTDTTSADAGTADALITDSDREIPIDSTEEYLKHYTLSRQAGVSVNQVNIVSRGKASGDIQLGFMTPTDIPEEPEGFVGWLLIYDTEDFDQVWNTLQGLSLSEIYTLSDIDGANQAYLADNFGWADGLGNTFNSHQRTFTSGDDFNLGIYHFYVATIMTEGVVGLMEANELIDLMPTPENLILTETNQQYSVEFDIHADQRLQQYFIMVSSRNFYDLQNELKSLSLADLENLAGQEKAMLVSSETTPGQTANVALPLDSNLLSYEGLSLKEEVQGIYVGSVGHNGLLDLAMANSFLVPNTVLETPQDTIGNGMGTLMLIGGGVASSDPNAEAVFDSMMAATEKELPKLAILSSSRTDCLTVYNHFYYNDPEFGSFESNYANLGFQPVFIPLATDNATSIQNDPYWASLLSSCDGAYLQGGDQYKHVKSLLNSDGSPSLMLQALQSILERGGVVAGTSAGMSAMGEYAYGYGYSLEALSHNDMEFKSLADIPVSDSIISDLSDNNLATPGIGLVEDHILLDTHFDRRGRLGRLMVALRDSGQSIGIGVDEGTSLNIENQIGTVVGHQGVFILDSSEASYGTAGSETIFTVENLKLHYLTEGDRYDFWSNNARQSESKEAIVSSGTYSGNFPVFGIDYATTKALIDFMASEDTLLELPFKLLDGTVITIAFEKKADTKGYTSNLNYDDPYLEGYKKASIENLYISVYQHKGEDTMPPVISYMTSYTKAYKTYLGITDNLSGIDETSINEDTITFVSEVNTLYRAPFYDAEYLEIGIVIAEDAFVVGDEVHVNGAMDLAGNVVEPQVWIFDGSEWIKQ
jgi:cyanophycinase